MGPNLDLTKPLKLILQTTAISPQVPSRPMSSENIIPATKDPPGTNWGWSAAC